MPNGTLAVPVTPYADTTRARRAALHFCFLCVEEDGNLPVQPIQQDVLGSARPDQHTAPELQCVSVSKRGRRRAASQGHCRRPLAGDESHAMPRMHPTDPPPLQ